MSLLKQLDRAAKTCWCPSALYPNLLASGQTAPHMRRKGEALEMRRHIRI